MIGQVIRKTGIYLFCALALACVSALSVPGETLPSRAYTTSDGLAHDRVNAIVRDARGFLWFCTSEGLSRFDGYQFKNYSQDDGLPHRAVTDLLETRDGSLWLATGDGVVLFDPLGVSDATEPRPAGGPMFRTFRPDDLQIGHATWFIQDLIEDRSGTIWLAAVNGLYRLDRSGDVPKLSRVDTEAWGHRSRDFSALLEDRTGALWIGAERGLYRLLTDGTVQRLDAELRIGAGAMLEDRAGNIWAGTNGGESKGLYLYDLPSEQAEPRLVRVFDHRDGLSGDHWINALRQTSDGRLLVGLANGLCLYDPDAGPGSKPFSQVFKAALLALAEDSGGNLWLGTGSSGALRMARRGFTSFDASDGLGTNGTASIIRGSDGETYVLATPYAISRFEGKRFSTVKPLEMALGNWSLNQITFQDHLGEWWVSAYTGLQRYPRVERLEDLATTKPKRLYTMHDGLIDNSVFQLFETSGGDIWLSIIGTNLGVQRWDRATDTIDRFTDHGFPAGNCPTAFGEDRAGNIWMGFYLGGLGRFRNGRFEQFTAADGVPPGFVRDIHTDAAGRIWVATSSGGVVRVDEPIAEKPALVNLTTAQGLSSNQANCLAEDSFGRMYVGTGRGVSRLDTVTGRVKIFTTTDGLRQNMISVCEADAKGALWFASDLGISRYVPTDGEQTPPPPIFIGSVRAGGESVRKLSELGEASVDGLALASDQRQLQIEFFALGFSTAETLRYQYKLDSARAEWSEPATQRSVNLSLSPGAYRFLVQAVTADGVLSEHPAVVSFSIERPVWQRWWFLMLLAAALAGVIYVVYRYRLKRLVELEKVRTRIATDLHDDIGASLSKISILSELVQRRIGPVAAGDAAINQPLVEIGGTSRDLVDSMSDIVWAIDPERDHLRDLLQRMRNLAGEMTELADIGLRFSSIETEDLGEISVGADIRRETYLVFKETINNLVKHSSCTMVEIGIKMEKGFLVVSVRDDGTGFDTAAGQNGDQTSRGGNGLRNMRRRAAALGGRYDITSAAGTGTTAVLSIPLDGRKSKLGLRSLFRKA